MNLVKRPGLGKSQNVHVFNTIYMINKKARNHWRSFYTKIRRAAGVIRANTGCDPVKSVVGGKMNREFLKEFGLEKEAIDKIMAENGRDVESYKAQVSALTNEKERLSGQLDEANKQIEEFKDLDVDGIKKAAAEYKAKFEEAEKKAKSDMEALQFDYALTDALGAAKARNAKAVKALLDAESLRLKDGEIVGLKDQLEKIKAENDYLFESEETTPRIVAPTGATAPISDDAAIRAVMGLPDKK